MRHKTLFTLFMLSVSVFQCTHAHALDLLGVRMEFIHPIPWVELKVVQPKTSRPSHLEFNSFRLVSCEPVNVRLERCTYKTDTTPRLKSGTVSAGCGVINPK